MTINARHVKNGALIFVNGKRANGNLQFRSGENIEITLEDLPEPGIHFLQIQNKGGLFSNDFIFHVADNEQRAKEIRLLKSEQIKTQKLSIIETLERMEDPKILTLVVHSADVSDLREITDEIKSRFKKFAVVLGTVSSGKVLLVSRVSKTLVDTVSAKEALDLSAGIIGGKGGGRADFAQAGGSVIENIDLAFKEAEQYFSKKLGKVYEK